MANGILSKYGGLFFFFFFLHPSVHSDSRYSGKKAIPKFVFGGSGRLSGSKE